MVGISCQLTTLGRPSASPTNHDALAPLRAAIRSAQIAHGYVRAGTTAASTCWQAVAACPGQILLPASRGGLGRALRAATRPHLAAHARLRAPPTATLCGTHARVSHVVSLSPPPSLLSPTPPLRPPPAPRLSPAPLPPPAPLLWPLQLMHRRATCELRAARAPDLTPHLPASAGPNASPPRAAPQSSPRSPKTAPACRWRSRRPGSAPA